MRQDSRIHPLQLWLPAIAVCLLAVSTQSFWIDEANSAVKAIQPTWAGFWSKNVEIGGSDLQMPLYMGMLWVWEKIAGPSEYGLRALNIPLFLAAILAVTGFMRRSEAERLAFAALTCLSPMLWSYLDEARPYLLQFLASTIVMVSLVNLASTKEEPRMRDLVLGLLGAVLLCGSSLTGVIYTAYLGVVFLVLWQSRGNIFHIFRAGSHLVALVVAAILLGLLGAYYLWTLKAGARASAVGTTTIATTVFCFYELLGVTGWGPGRVALRDAGVGALKPFLPALAIFAVVAISFVIAGGRAVLRRKPSNWRLLFLFAGAGLGAGTMILLGVVMDFRVVGRHLMPLLPFLILGESLLLCALWRSEQRIDRLIARTFLLVLAVSAVSLRFAPRFAKDDYRGAATIVKETISRGGVSWWAADQAGAVYYGVFPAYPGDKAQVFFANSRSSDYLGRLPAPQIVVLSKLDVYDKTGALREFLSREKYRKAKELPAMNIWEKN